MTCANHPATTRGVYVDGPNGTRICSKHEEQFKPPHACPKCRRAPATKRKPSSLPPEIDQAMAEAVVELEGIAEEAAEMISNMTGEVAKVAALRVRMSALSKVSDIKMERAKSEMLDRLANHRPASTAAIDPRDAFGITASDEIFVEGDN